MTAPPNPKPAGGLPRLLSATLNAIIARLPFPVSRKVATQFITAVLTYAAALACTRLGLHLDAAAAGYVSAGIAAVAGAGAAWFVREEAQPSAR